MQPKHAEHQRRCWTTRVWMKNCRKSVQLLKMRRMSSRLLKVCGFKRLVCECMYVFCDFTFLQVPRRMRMGNPQSQVTKMLLVMRSMAFLVRQPVRRRTMARTATGAS